MSAPAVLLLNLGSPKSTSVADVSRYLNEFLGDERVIDRPDNAFLRSQLVKRIIIPKRVKNSAHAYEKIWTTEGSPLIATSTRSRDALRATAACPVEVAMNYGEPSIGDTLRSLAAAGVDRLLLFPQYPHYAMSSWETVVAKTRREAAALPDSRAPSMRIESVMPYYGDADYIEALVESARPYLNKPHDQLLFSYHGIPVRHLTKADSSRAHCQVVPDCCKVASPAHATCYKA
ncbi:MAG TPA: ferrochelatase, partial [Opitutaceae bacterium]